MYKLNLKRDWGTFSVEKIFMVISNKAQTNLVFPWFLNMFIATFATNNYWNIFFCAHTITVYFSASPSLSLYCFSFFFFSLTLHWIIWITILHIERGFHTLPFDISWPNSRSIRIWQLKSSVIRYCSVCQILPKGQHKWLWMNCVSL